MSLFLSNFSGKNQNIDSPTNASAKGGDGEYASALKVAEAIRSMIQGQTISGEVLEINGKDIQLLLENNVIIKARLEQSIQISLGEILNFEVKSNVDGQVAIRPLFLNIGEEEPLLKALDEAGIVPNEKNVEMVKALMEEGLPIDKKSLQFMYRQILTNPEISVSFLAQMRRLQIPFTPQNIEQFQAYKNYEHQLAEGIESVAKQLPKEVSDLIALGKVEEATTLIKKILDSFTQEGIAKGNEQGTSLGGKVENSIQNLMQDVERPDIMERRDGMAKNELPQDAIGRFLKREERQMLVEVLKEAGVAEETLHEVQKGEISAKEVLQLLKPLMGEEYFSKETWKTFFSSETFSKIVKEEVLRQWTITPDEIPKDKSIEELYTRIREQTSRLLEAVSSTMKPDGSFLKEVGSLRENIDFMNQLNQMFTYVQIPLKMTNQNAHGELYVYTNKKNLAKKDGNVTALLHLDMEHLGSIDIFVALQKEMVSTKFYLEKEEFLDFVESNMHFLNERLQKRGYNVQDTEVLLKEKQTNVMEEILKQDKQNIMIGQHAFDVRA